MASPETSKAAAKAVSMPRLDLATLQAIPTGIWALGLVSLFMDVSSEMIHSLLPVYLVGTLGASVTMVGVIEGIAEATANITKVFSGALSDRWGARKSLALAGYGMAAFTKPIFPLAGSIGWLVAARFLDRVGKGIRGSPRDALVADISPPELRGASFGLRQSLDTVGAFLGPLIAIVLMLLSGNNFTLVFWVAVVPAFFSVAVLALGVNEPARPVGLRTVRAPLSLTELYRLGRPYWQVVAIASVFTLARFSEAFLILKAGSAGLGASYAPTVLVLMNVVYALSAYPAGVIADRGGPMRMLTLGLWLLVAADVVLTVTHGLAGAAIGIALWGLHMGFTQGVVASLVADTAPAELRGTAFGMLNLLMGLAMLAASLIAGRLWDVIGPEGTFLAGAAFALLALAGLSAIRRPIAQAP